MADIFDWLKRVIAPLTQLLHVYVDMYKMETGYEPGIISEIEYTIELLKGVGD